jgi:glycosyltransferase involved in cell wall biosynthesis
MSEERFRLSSVSFFCPAYNDAGNLPDLIPVVHKFLSENSDKFEITIIDDGAKDKTGAVADELAIKYSCVRVVHHEQNKGYAATLQEGFENAKYEYVMYTDGDNQYDVMEFVPYLYLLKDNDIISGYATKKAVSLLRKFQSNVHNYLVSLLFLTWIKDINCSMKIFKKRVLDSIDINSSPFGAFIDAELILKARKKGFKIAQFPVTHYERKSGIASGSKPGLVLKTILDMIKLRLNIL